MEVFPLFARGATVSQVAERTGLSAVTVQGRKSRLLKLFGVPSILEAVEKAQGYGILPT